MLLLLQVCDLVLELLDALLLDLEHIYLLVVLGGDFLELLSGLLHLLLHPALARDALLVLALLLVALVAELLVLLLELGLLVVEVLEGGGSLELELVLLGLDLLDLVLLLVLDLLEAFLEDVHGLLGLLLGLGVDLLGLLELGLELCLDLGYLLLLDLLHLVEFPLVDHADLDEFLLQLEVLLDFEVDLFLEGLLDLLCLLEVPLVEGFQGDLGLGFELVDLVLDPFYPVVDVVDDPVLLQLQFQHLVAVPLEPLLHQQLQLLGQVVDDLRVLSLLVVDLLNLLLVDQHHVCQEVVDDHVGLLIVLQHPLDLVADLPEHDHAVLSGGDEVLASGAEGDVVGLADVVVLVVHEDGSLQSAEHQQPPTLQGQDESLLLAKSGLSHGDHFLVELELADAGAVAAELLNVLLVLVDSKDDDGVAAVPVDPAAVLDVLLDDVLGLGPVLQPPLDDGALLGHRQQALVVLLELQAAHHRGVVLQLHDLLQGERVEEFDVVDVSLLAEGVADGEQVPPSGELDQVGSPDPQLPIGTQLVVEHVEQPEFVHTGYCEVVAGGVEGEGDEGLVGVELLLEFEVEHPEEFAAVVLVVPDPDGAVLLAAGGDEGALLADVHARDGAVVEPLVHVLEHYLLVSHVVEQVRHLRDQLVDRQRGHVVVGQRDDDDVLLQADVDVGDLGRALLARSPLPRKLECLLALEVVVLLLGPQRELAVVAAQDEALGESADGRDEHFVLLEFVEDVAVLLPDFEEVGPGLFQDEYFALVSGCDDHLLLVPGVGGDPAPFRQLLDFLQRLEGVLLDLEHPQRTASAHADQVAVARTDGQLVDVLER